MTFRSERLDVDTIERTRWWLARCHVGQEVGARDYLHGLGFAVIAPREVYYAKPSRYVRGRGRRIEREKAAMPGWLVVGFLPGGPGWSRFMVERERIGYPRHGVRAITDLDGHPVRVKPGDARALIDLENDPRLFPKDYQRHQHRRREYDAGDQVEIIDGPFAGRFATVDFIREDGRVLVRLHATVIGVDQVELYGETLAKAV